MRILLDSNAYAAFMRGSHEMRDPIRDAEEGLLSAMVVGELLYGFRQGARFEQNLAELRSFLLGLLWSKHWLGRARVRFLYFRIDGYHGGEFTVSRSA